MSLQPDYDLIIAGAGPAGAWTLKHLPGGKRVLLVDAGNPLESSREGKLCGGMLTTQAQALLPELPAEIRAEPFKTKLEYYDLDNGAGARFPVDYANCHRRLLDGWLLRQALEAKGKDVEYLPGTRVTGLYADEESVLVQLDEERKVHASRFFDCTGWRQVARRALGVSLAPYYHALQAECALSRPYPHYVAVFLSEWSPFFGWYIPKGKSIGEVGAAFASDRRHAPDTLLEPLVEHLRQRTFGFEPGRIRGCRLTRLRRASDIWLGQGAVLACGEAGGLVSPSSGDGISYALASGRAAAQTAGMPAKAARQAYRLALKPQLDELKRNTVKARWLADPRARRFASALLPLAHRGQYERLSL